MNLKEASAVAIGRAAAWERQAWVSTICSCIAGIALGWGFRLAGSSFEVSLIPAALGGAAGGLLHLRAKAKARIWRAVAADPVNWWTYMGQLGIEPK